MSDQVSHLRNLLAARTRAERDGLTAESAAAAEVGPNDPVHADDVLARVNDIMKRMPADDVRDPEEFERALAIFLREADRGLRSLDKNPDAPIDPDATIALEAVIRTDGTRPSLLVKNDVVDSAHPLAASWQDTLVTVRDRMRERIAAVGRVEPTTPSGNNFFGTCWLVDKGKGLVLTNLHVVEAMWKRLPNAMIKKGNGFRVLPGAAFVDFAAESGSLVKRRFQIVEATPSGVDGAGFARLDAAVLKIEPIEGDTPSPPLPNAIPVVADVDGPLGNRTSFAVVGFPGPPPYTTGTREGVDWIWVNTTLFGSKFGVKRVSPGQAHRPLGTLAGDTKPWVFGHDATTLGGNSGSVVVAWLDQGAGGFGLHFSGASLSTNCAHAIAQMQDRLQALGVPVQAPQDG